MSYNSLKRVLGETSLEWKCRILFGVCLGFMIAASFWFYGSRTENIVYQNSRNDGQHLVDAVMLQRHWMKMDVPLDSHQFLDMPVSALKFIKLVAKNLQTHRDYAARVFKPGAKLNPPTGDDAKSDSENGEDRPQTKEEADIVRFFTQQPVPPPEAWLLKARLNSRKFATPRRRNIAISSRSACAKNASNAMQRSAAIWC